MIERYDPRGGGAEVWTDRHARMLLADGHEVHVVASSLTDLPPAAHGHTVARCAGRLRFAARLADSLRALPVDVIHDMGAGWYADVFMPHYGTRRANFMQQTKAMPALPRVWRAPAYRCLPRYVQFRRLESRQYRDAPGRAGKLIVAVSDMVADHMKTYCGVPDSRIRVVYNGVDTERFTPSADAEARKALREQAGFDDDTAVFLMVAHDWELKGIRPTLGALRRLLEEGARVGLVIVGAGTMRRRGGWGAGLSRPRDYYPGLAHQWGIGQAVHFAGAVDDPRPWYRAADVYIQPSLYDACSLVVLEAMACGLPVITSVWNGVCGLITRGREGVIVNDPLSAPEVADAMRACLPTPRRREMSVSSRAAAEANPLARNYRRIMNVYEEIIAARRD